MLSAVKLCNCFLCWNSHWHAFFLWEIFKSAVTPVFPWRVFLSVPISSELYAPVEETEYNWCIKYRKKRKTANTQITKFLLNLYRKGFFTPLGRGIDWCLMCDRYPPFGTNPMMPMLGEPPMGFPDPLRGSLLGLHPYGHPGYGLGLGPILPVPVWRPLAAHPSAVLCNNIGCPCNRSSAAMNELLEMYKSSPPSTDPWRPWYPKHSGKFCCET